MTVFTRFLAVSAAGALAALLLIALCAALGRKLGVRWKYYCWLPVLAAMLLTPLVPLPTAKLPPSPLARAAQAVAQPPATVPAVKTLDTGSGPSVHIVEEPAGPSPRAALPAVWLAGAGCALLWYAAHYAALLRRLRAASETMRTERETRLLAACASELGVRRRVCLRVSAAASTPMLVGVLCPTVVLPRMVLTDEELRYVFLHELTHLRRGDLGYKWLAIAVCVAHWYNPMAYVMLARINTLCELACDQTVAADWDEPRRKGYMRTILRLAGASVGVRSPAATAMCASRRHLEKRLAAILKAGRARAVQGVAAVLLSIAVGVGTVCAGAASRDAGTPAQTPSTAVVQPMQETPDSLPEASGAVAAPPAAREAAAADAADNAPQPDAGQAPTIPAGQAAEPAEAPRTQETEPEEPVQAEPPLPGNAAIKPDSPDAAQFDRLKPGTNLQNLRAAIEADGKTAVTGAACDLRAQYRAAEYSITGREERALLSAVKSDENGLACVYFSSPFAAEVTLLLVEQDSRELVASRSTRTGDATAVQVFSGLEPDKTYEIILENYRDTDYAVTGTALVY